jgi:DNA ligase (NAD+)
MDRIAQLQNLILRAKQAYYHGNKPLMEDIEYDALEDELRGLDPENSVLHMTGCPLPSDGILEKATHRIHMGSQDKVNTEEEFRKWYAKNAQGQKLHVSLKGDGASAAAYYDSDEFVMGISRGDGIIGEDITANIAKFKGLPLRVSNFGGSIRFEAILTKADWAITGGKNPRNQGSGIIGRKDGTESEHITVYAFDVASHTTFATETEKSLFLQSIGVNPMPWKTVDSADEAVEYYNFMMEARGEGNSGGLPFWIDGIVIKIDDLAVQEELGLSPSGKYHKGQVAWKPDEEGATTILRSIVLTGGHTGNIIPNARFDPVEVGGTTVRRAILNNWEEIERLGIAVGDTIFVVKANEIIPKLRRVVDRVYECPECGFSGTLKEQEEHHKLCLAMQ